MINRTPSRVDGIATYNQIIKTAKKLFSQKGFHGTSINSIISSSKIAAGTFYQYFNSKKELYFYLVKDYRSKILKTIHDATLNYSTRYEIEYHGIKAYLDFVKKDPLAYQIIWESLFVQKDYFFNYYNSFADSYYKRLSATNEIVENIDLSVLSYVLIGISNFVGIQYISEKEEKPSEFYIDEIMKILRQGIFKSTSL
jgi:AcrR family transcriptional regulator